MTESVEWLKKICELNRTVLTEKQIRQLEQYAELLLLANRKVNLISRQDEENIWESHILHSLSVIINFQIPYNAKILDIGTGGGLPGVPLKILRPDLSVLLLDSIQKKVDAVRAFINDIGLRGTEVVYGRAEDVGKKEEFRKKFDLTISRAVAPLKNLIKWSKPFLGDSNTNVFMDANQDNVPILLKSPSILALKGGDIAKETAIAQKIFSHSKITVVDIVVEGTNYFKANAKKAVLVQL